ncbi:major facilitator superfamily domain-containing protein [Amylocarpus encephaloides]|uniref:Major facilitator superfamily domain-containing protein n=1 Tax=Amylocarpus encephaloides TaxID=45428 RepID=A0A9P7YHT2_9HELO|nr:major facilitator superfamily domain-containing protein [Amylocarpus encephaloides]
MAKDSDRGQDHGDTKELPHSNEMVSESSSPSNRKSRGAQTLWRWVNWTPKRCRWDPDDPPKFTMGLNLLFGFAGTFTVANLYYNHPILNILADEFNVSDERASLIPTMMQAGYAAGLLFLCPLGDIFHRRPFVLILVFFTATVWIGLCVTKSYPVFLALSFITAVSTVTPQLMLPLVGDLAPPNRRATALSIVVSGLLLGMLIARLLSGILTQYTSWRSIYFLSLALQYFIFVLLWLFMPDYPSTNPGGLNYFRMLWSIVSMFFHEPLLVQASTVGFCLSTTFTSFWTTLTFLLAGEPYGYNPIQIGLFALVGIGSMAFGPPYSRIVIDHFPPLYSVLLGCLYVLTGLLLGAFIGGPPVSSIVGPIICAFALEFGLQTAQIANRMSIYTIAPKARNRVNTAFMVSVFCGQLAGTAIGNKVYAIGGWKVSGGVSMGFVGVAICIVLLRGPWEERWAGWRGGWGRRKKGGGPPGEATEERKVEDGSHEPVRDAVLEELGAEGVGSDETLAVAKADENSDGPANKHIKKAEEGPIDHLEHILR